MIAYFIDNPSLSSFISILTIIIILLLLIIITIIAIQIYKAIKIHLDLGRIFCTFTTIITKLIKPNLQFLPRAIQKRALKTLL